MLTTIHSTISNTVPTLSVSPQHQKNIITSTIYNFRGFLNLMKTDLKKDILVQRDVTVVKARMTITRKNMCQNESKAVSREDNRKRTIIGRVELSRIKTYC